VTKPNGDIGNPIGMVVKYDSRKNNGQVDKPVANKVVGTKY
jgi:hypothetical protein